MLVLLPLTMWGQGYWKQIDKKIHLENDGEHFEGVKMEGTFGRFSMSSKQLKDGKWGQSPDHDNCKGEWVYEIATYTEPQQYYTAGDVVESHIQTSTSHSSHICGCHSKSLNLSAGLYIVRLCNGNDVKTQKIVIE